MNPINILDLVTQASLPVQIIMLCLAVMSVVSWGFVIHIYQKITHMLGFDQRFIEWHQQKSNDEIYHSLQAQNTHDGLEIVAYHAYREIGNIHHNDAVKIFEKQCQAQIAKQQLHLEKGLSTLASISSIAPYIGLLGTVWGIMNAFIGLANTGNMTLAVVAPAIAEALIATALGLFTAIIASAAYNYLSNQANYLYEQRVAFCDDLIARLLKNASRHHDSRQDLPN